MNVFEILKQISGAIERAKTQEHNAGEEIWRRTVYWAKLKSWISTTWGWPRQGDWKISNPPRSSVRIVLTPTKAVAWLIVILKFLGSRESYSHQRPWFWRFHNIIHFLCKSVHEIIEPFVAIILYRYKRPQSYKKIPIFRGQLKFAIHSKE